MDRCIKRVVPAGEWRDRRCNNKATRGSYCHVHHPKAAEERREAKLKREEDRAAKSPWKQLERMTERCKELELENKSLRERLQKLSKFG